jgi:serine/threonine-protein kinase
VSEITLTVIAGPHAGATFTFAGRDNFLVGREPPCHFLLPGKDEALSRVHFLIELNPPLCQLTDLNSSNGTFVNGERVTAPMHLKDGDQVRAGRTVFAVAIRQPGEPTIIVGIPVDDESAPPRPPELLPPGFEWERELGRGGMGVVHLARMLNTGRLCAVKTVRPAANATRRDVDRFLREIRVLSELRHPHIVAFHQFEVLRGHFFLIMEYVEGTDAHRVLAAEGPLPVRRAVDWACQLLDALDHAHGRGFVHRDIKPANLLIAREGGREVVKVADFGLARTYEASRLSGLTRLGDVAGTPAFLPPEQITAFRKTGPAADQYAAAATLYNLLTGKYVHDFPAGASASLLKVMHEDAVPLRARRPELPAGLEAVVHRALSRDPDRRFPGAAALRQELLWFVGTDS